MSGTDSKIIIITGYPAIVYFKIITEDVLSNGYLHRIIIKTILCITDLHLHTLLTTYKIYRVNIVSLCTEFNRYSVPGLRFCRISVKFCSITEKRLFIKYRTHV